MTPIPVTLSDIEGYFSCLITRESERVCDL